ncbi:ubiquitin carboxyl-terminal hydrolase 10 isoform X2 [Lingula anatina]|uniref:Ubiquitin carboxyl-terminal hydrolase n=1 Tax=Lingula anatina TaxID=7574 RepID=A0A1S3JH05_LINAN|nr:ubiquitin carboxyl-terminal hydrolase 10 isoform X2 [Lingula anatina]|eukprot:XP_013409690.1 ubiquitin carboxyl-terminal hydrolase 10 isoform X2 [Lingula anatina]
MEHFEISFLDLGNLSPDEESQLIGILYEPKDNYPIEFPWTEPNCGDQGGQGDGSQGAERGHGPVQYQNDHGHFAATLGITFGDVGDELFTASGYSPLPVQTDQYSSANLYTNQRDDSVQSDDGGKGGAKERRNKKKRPPGYYELIDQKQKGQQVAGVPGSHTGQNPTGQHVDHLGQVASQFVGMHREGQCPPGPVSLAKTSGSTYRLGSGGQTGAYMDTKPPGGQENYGAYMNVEPPEVVMSVKHSAPHVGSEPGNSIQNSTSHSNAMKTSVHSPSIPQQGSDMNEASQAIEGQLTPGPGQTVTSLSSVLDRKNMSKDSVINTDSRGLENRTGSEGIHSGKVVVEGNNVKPHVVDEEGNFMNENQEINVSKSSDGTCEPRSDGILSDTTAVSTDDHKLDSNDVNNTQASQDASEITQNAAASQDGQPPEGGNGAAQKPTSWASLFRGGSSQQSVTYVVNSEEQQGEKAKSPSPAKPEEPLPEPVTVSASEDKKAKKVGELLLGAVVSHRPAPLQPRGLVNRGNWCYINATLQALMACPPFYNLLKQMPAFFSARNRGPSSTPILDSFVELANEFVPYQYPKGKKNKGVQDINPGKPFEPVNVYKMLQLIKSNNFMHGKQEDAEEFLSCVLNGLHDEMLAAINEVDGRNIDADPEKSMNGDTQVMDGEAAEGEEEGEDEWEQVGRRNKSVVTRMSKFAHSPITEIFGGSIRSALYQHGSKESATLESFLTLQLDIQNEKVQSVKEAIASLATKESLQGFTCSKTKMEVEASRRTTLEELPPVLVLHLKCFVYDKNGGSQKVVKHVEYGVDLEVSRDLLSPNVRSKLPTGQRTYKLFAVVYHHGKNATGGHYTTDIYHNGINGWMRIDDSTVKVVTVPQLMKYSPPRVPYLLYYRRCDLI